MQLGVCYYPEQWPETLWADDARRMVELGITHVRIAEFAWCGFGQHIEPAGGNDANAKRHVAGIDEMHAHVFRLRSRDSRSNRLTAGARGRKSAKV